MDWCNQKDRLALVKECDFVCDDECFDSDECEKCIAKNTVVGMKNILKAR